MTAAGRIHERADRDAVGVASALVGKAAAEEACVSVPDGDALGDVATDGVGDARPPDEDAGVGVDWTNEYRAMLTPVSMSVRSWYRSPSGPTRTPVTGVSPHTACGSSDISVGSPPPTGSGSATYS